MALLTADDDFPPPQIENLIDLRFLPHYRPSDDTL